MTWLRKLAPEIKHTLLLFVVSRIMLTIIGVISRSLFPYPFTLDEYIIYTGFTPFDLWGVWDAWWYTGIADYGYVEVFPPREYGNYAFFPLYPMLMRTIGSLIDSNYLAGLLISNLALIATGVMLYRLARKDYDHSISIHAVTALFLFPTAFIFSGVMTESLFLLLVVLAFYCARSKYWLLAGLFGMFAALTKQLGFLLFIPLALEYWQSRGKWTDAWPLLLIPIGLLIVMLAQYVSIGDALGFLHVQSEFDRPISPMHLFTGLTFNAPNILAAVFAIIGLGALCVNYKKMRTSYFVFGIYCILIPLATGVVAGVPRFLLQIFPLFFIIAQRLNTRHGLLLAAILALLQGCFMVFWTAQSLLVV